MHCPSCRAANEADAEECFTCGFAFSSGEPVKQGDTIGGRYVVLARLGRGGMGTVYKAYDRVLEEDVALKVLREAGEASPERARRFRSEIRLARKIVHRNVCRIYEYGEDNGRHFISMELIDGVDFKRLLHEKGPLPVREAYDVALQVAHGLEAIHEAGIVHRDLKTPNLMRDARGQVRLMDFGIAKRFDQAGLPSTGTTSTGSVVGTPDYMSPEQARAEIVDLRSDIYALGVVLFELFTGELPFRADTPMATMLKHLHEQPPLEGPRAARLPLPLRPVLARALAKHPAQRFQSVRDLIRALEVARVAGDPSAAMPETLAGAEAIAPPGAELTADVSTPTAAPRAGARPSPVRFRAALWGALALAGVVTVVTTVAVRRPRASPADLPAAVAPLPSPPKAGLPVRINALPWARISLAPVGHTAVVPPLAGDEDTTPLLLELAEGEYVIEMENDGLTPPLTRRIHVRAGQANEFLFALPGYDPAAAAEAGGR